MPFPERLKFLHRSFCQSYDMKQHSTKVFRDIVNALGSFIQSLFLVPPTGNPAAVNQAGTVVLRLVFPVPSISSARRWERSLMPVQTRNTRVC